MTERLLRQFADGPRAVMWLCLAVLTMLGWALLWHNGESVIAALCTVGQSSSFGDVLSIWLAMSLAIMLPSAAPMISVYMDIAEAARARSMAVISPLILASGYLAVWMGFSIAAAILQIQSDELAIPAQAAALLLIAAGLYQFAPLKHACLAKCRHPMPFFMAQWSDRAGDVFRIGVSQGLHCLGCCWALMLLGFVAGLMNVVWMAAIGILMVLEKTLPQPKPVVYGVGLGLIGAGAMLAIQG